ncbi:tetratricopeptide repeat protein [Acidaminobacter sp. JC074]|uniref:tetratricopeptide repeat protein n=1 Tax=Acidaminobacter sp. JC074 TaxID=2530199 RepID=UPI001F10C1E7|nr:tetratricopeptide repeat protein [Acidaminobacter sp. JC074]MCH4888064.1 tetratricopeptide repeat protein [Acidaminobacter sp. JC074]
MEKVDGLLEIARQKIYTDSVKGKEALDEAYELSKAEGYKKGEAWSLLRLGSYALKEGQRYKAIDLFDDALKLFEKIEDKQGISRAYFSLGTIAGMMGNFGESLKYLYKSKDLSYDYDKKYYSKLMNNIAETYIYLEDYTMAIKICQHVVDFMSEEKIHRMFVPYVTLGLAYQGLGYHEDALQSAEKALLFLEDSQEDMFKSVANMVIGGAYKGLKQYDEALIIYNRALKQAIDFGDYQNVSKLNAFIGEIYFIKKEYDYAFRHLQEAMVVALKHHSKRDESIVYKLYADVYESLENYKKAFTYLKKGAELEHEILKDRIKQQNRELVDYDQS